MRQRWQLFGYRGFMNIWYYETLRYVQYIPVLPSDVATNLHKGVLFFKGDIRDCYEV